MTNWPGLVERWTVDTCSVPTKSCIRGSRKTAVDEWKLQRPKGQKHTRLRFCLRDMKPCIESVFANKLDSCGILEVARPKLSLQLLGLFGRTSSPRPSLVAQNLMQIWLACKKKRVTVTGLGTGKAAMYDLCEYYKASL